jgi:hypothetical protein
MSYEAAVYHGPQEVMKYQKLYKCSWKKEKKKIHGKRER